MTNADRISELEQQVAAFVRQFGRADAAQDALAARLTERSLGSSLKWLLQELLESEGGWPSEERWLDGLFRTRIDFRSPNQISVSGPMVWGLNANAGGQEWAEPFDTVVLLKLNSGDLDRYRIRFGDRSRAAEDCKQVDEVMTRIESGAVDWKYVFAK